MNKSSDAEKVTEIRKEGTSEKERWENYVLGVDGPPN